MKFFNFTKIGLFIIILFISTRISAQQQINFDTYFIDQTLRIDFYHTGDAKEEFFVLDKIYKQGIWAGNPNKCIHPFDLGAYFVRVYDVASNKQIYSKGFSSIFGEYRTTSPAIEGIKHTYHETILIPVPKRSFLLVIEKRQRNNLLIPVFTQKLDPNDYHIITETFRCKSNEAVEMVKNGNPHQLVDLVIVGEGYQATERDKFLKDLKYYTDLFFSIEPYKSRKKLFNITGIFTPSEESGTDEPRQGKYKNTKINTTFNIFDTDRYMLAEDNKTLRDVLAGVPYDAILVMVNLDRYGGGGIYNCQTVFATGSPWRDYVFIHEFGHAFADLGDEYYTKSVAYDEFYPRGIEPLEPNITALLDTANVKWKEYLSPGIKVPTEWGKNVFDSLNVEVSRLYEEREVKIAELKNAKASEQEIKKVSQDYDSKITRTNKEIDAFIANHPLRNKVGVFEGAGYQSKGFYRPTIMSMMHKFDEKDKSYGIVNEQAIIVAIKYYTE